MSKAKAKGTVAESALVKFLVGQGFPGAERRALSGSNDMGDVTGTPCLAWEVKNHKSYSLSAWLKETAIEKDNAGADFGILVAKPNGIGMNHVGDWWAVMRVADIVDLLRAAGYGDPK